MIRSLFFVVLFSSITAVYAQRMDQDFTPPFMYTNNNPAVYPDMDFTVVKGYEDKSGGIKLVDYIVTYTIKYATDGVLYTYTLPEGIYGSYGKEPKYTKEQFLNLTEVQEFIFKYSK